MNNKILGIVIEHIRYLKNVTAWEGTRTVRRWFAGGLQCEMNTGKTVRKRQGTNGCITVVSLRGQHNTSSNQ